MRKQQRKNNTRSRNGEIDAYRIDATLWALDFIFEVIVHSIIVYNLQ